MSRFAICVALLFAALAMGASHPAALAGCCDHCGCQASCDKVCRLVCEEKQVAVICWGCKSEDFCVPGPSRPGCKHCEIVCDECDEKQKADAPQSAPKKFVWREWIPGCATIYTKKKLLQRIVTKKIPSYKWVVEDLCPPCEEKAKSALVAPGAEIPPVPMGIAKVKPAQVDLAAHVEP